MPARCAASMICLAKAVVRLASSKGSFPMAVNTGLEYSVPLPLFLVFRVIRVSSAYMGVRRVRLACTR